MAAEFDRYKERKGMWFWIELTIATYISDDPAMSAKKSDHIVEDFIDSAFYLLLVNNPNYTDREFLRK